MSIARFTTRALGSLIAPTLTLGFATDHWPLARAVAAAKQSSFALPEEAHATHLADRNVLMALVSIGRDHGDFAAALRHARELLTLDPGNTQLQALVSELEKKARP